MKLDWFIQFLIVLCFTLAVTSESYYFITAPGMIQSNRKYSIVVGLLEANVSGSIRVTVEGPDFKKVRDVNLQPLQSKIIQFNIKHKKLGQYFLKAEGLNGLNFQNSTRLNSLSFYCPKIYIQTDKSYYKSQDLMRLRFVVLDEHTRPFKMTDVPIHVEIRDNHNNRVKQFKNISLTHGSFTGTYKLPKYPLVGNMTIIVKLAGRYDCYRTKRVNIADYTLPKFSVYLKTPTNVVLEDGNIKVIIYGKYTFGKYVEGKATIEMWMRKAYLIQKKQVNIESLSSVDFNLKEIGGIENLPFVVIVATLTENLTGQSYQQEKIVDLHRYRYNLIVSHDEIEFENNEPYSIRVYVKHWTGAPVLDRKTPMTMQHGDKVYESLLDATGAATFEFDYNPNENYKFQFKDSSTELPNIYTHNNLLLSNQEYYCRLKVLNKKIKLGKPVRIEVSSVVNIPYLMYTIMGHASLLHAKYIKLQPNRKSHIISITPSIHMIPRSFLFVYYVDNGHLRYGEITLNFPEELENQISISAPKTVKPSEEVTVTVNAQPKSYLGLLAVDLAVNILDDTYDLKKQEIIEDLHGEQSYAPVGLFLHPGMTSGMVTLSNAHVSLTSFYVPPPRPTVQPIPNDRYPGAHQLVPDEPPEVTEEAGFRQNFPETWIFDNYVVNDTQTKFTFKIPETITTWRLTGFSNNDVTGFGIVNRPTDIISIQNFFISLNLPYAVKRGEIVTIPVTIFNYSNQTLDTEVVLQNIDKEFYFMESKRQDVEKSSDEHQQIKQVTVAANKGNVVKFLIYPLKAGEITLRVNATSPSYSDAVFQKLKVHPEGVPQQENQAMYLSLPEGEKISSKINITNPINNVPDSEYITFSVGGHYLVPTVENFDNLTEIPTGSGEQNMINFAPSVLILQYLKINGKLTKEKGIVESLLSSIELSYQEQLSFRHDDGGYSVFGMGEDEEPNTWLTAYVVRYFIKASQFLGLETDFIEKDLEYLTEQQQSNGEFLFTGYLLNPNHKNQYGLTAFILLAFLEDQKYSDIYRNVIENGVEFLNSNLNNIHDINSLSLVAAVLNRAKRNTDILIDKLKAQGKEHKGLRWWSENNQNLANDIETTANVALALLDTPGDHIPILKWLIKQRNANGGFKSSYDTVAGMEALVKFSEKYKNPNKVNLKISYSAKDDMGNDLARDEFHVDSKNVLNFQKHELPRTTRHVTFEMEGSGVSLVQLTQQYNVNNVKEIRHFHIETESIKKNEKEYILKLCFNYIPEVDNSNGTSYMIIIEASLPSGFRSGSNDIKTLKKDLVKNVETKNSDTLIIFYLNKLKANERFCLEIPVDKVDEILKRRPAAILMYDYSNLTRSSTKFYNL